MLNEIPTIYQKNSVLLFFKNKSYQICLVNIHLSFEALSLTSGGHSSTFMLFFRFFNFKRSEMALNGNGVTIKDKNRPVRLDGLSRVRCHNHSSGL